jgi:Phytoene dehydrogenase and related proteins
MMVDFMHIITDHDSTYRSIAQFSKKDAEAYDRFGKDVMRQCKIIKPLLKMTPHDHTSFKPKDIMGLFEFAKYLAAKDELGGSGEKEIYDTIRFSTMSVRDYLEEYFESDIVKVHLAGSAIIGTARGPYSPGSAYVLLHHYMGEVDGTVGVMGLFQRRNGLDYKRYGVIFNIKQWRNKRWFTSKSDSYQK